MTEQQKIWAAAVTTGVFVVIAIPYLAIGHVPPISHLLHLGIQGRLLDVFAPFVGLWMIYQFAYHTAGAASYENWLTELKYHVVGLLVFGFLATGSAYYLGTHTENDDGMGGGDRVVDYEPTDDARVKEGLSFFFFLTVPGVMGMSRGFAEKKHQIKTAERIKSAKNQPRLSLEDKTTYFAEKMAPHLIRNGADKDQLVCSYAEFLNPEKPKADR